MANRTIYPLDAPTPPHWRGVSDIAGYVGDLFYGPYDRSSNFFVHNATAVAKRRGFVRALNEQFPGNASGEFCREKTRPVMVVGDGVGIKVLSSIPQTSGNTGNPFDDSFGYPSDDFERPDSASVHNPSHGEYWAESATGEGSVASSDYNQIDNNDWMVRHATDNNEATLYAGYLDKQPKNAPEPSPFYVVRAELDLTGLHLEGNADHESIALDYGKKSGAVAAGDDYSHFFAIGQGLPGPCKASLRTTNGETGWMLKNAVCFRDGKLRKKAPFCGALCLVQWRQQEKQSSTGDLRFDMRVLVSEFASNYRPNHGSIGSYDIKGGVPGADKYDSADPGAIVGSVPAVDDVFEVKNLTSAELNDSHTIEFGRVLVDGKSWVTRARLWRGKSLAEVSSATSPDVELYQESRHDGEVVQVGGDEAYLLQHPNTIHPGAQHYIDTFSGVGMGHLTPSATLETADLTHGPRCGKIVVTPDFL